MDKNELTLFNNNFNNSIQIQHSIELNNKIACIENMIETDSLGLGKSLTSIMKVIHKVVNPIYSLGNSLASSYTIKKYNESLKNSIENINNISGIDTIQKRALINNSIKSYKKQLNKESILNQALNNINIIDYSQDIHDDIFIDRFFEYAGNVSNIEMQILWSKILSNEIKQPKKYSLRLLEVLSKLSSEEARIFEKFVNKSLNLDNYIFRLSDKNLQFKHDLSDDDLLLLQEIGLIQFDLNINILDSDIIYASSIHIISIDNIGKKHIPLRIHTCTTIGFELASIILEDKQTFDDEVISDFCYYLKQKNKNIRFDFNKISESIYNLNVESVNENSFDIKPWNFNYNKI